MTTISAIITVGPDERFLEQALAAVTAQERAADEVIVVADGSPPAVAAIARHHRARLVVRGGEGVAAARNAGIDAAGGDLIALLDHDDLWAPGKLARQAAMLEVSPSADVAAGVMATFLEPGTSRPPWLPPVWLERPHRSPQVGTLLVRRVAFEQAGGFDPDAEPADDVDWLARAAAAGLRIERHDDVVLRYRIHAGNRSHATDALRSSVLGVARAAARRHAGAQR